MKALEPEWMSEDDALDAIRLARHVSLLAILEAYLAAAKSAGVPARGGCVERAAFLKWLRAIAVRKLGRPPGSKKSAGEDLHIATLAIAFRRVDPDLDLEVAIRGAIRQSTPGLPKRDDGGLPARAPRTHERRILRTIEDRGAEIEALLKDIPANAPGRVKFKPEMLPSAPTSSH